MSSDNGMIEVFSGGMIDPLAPRPEQIKLVDIAHALSNICRFTGHTRQFYSVAQHSALVARLLPPELRLWGLLHDASEAYIADVAQPVKPRLQNYREIEDRLQRVVCVRFGLRWPMPAEVLEADLILLATERRDLMPGNSPPWRPEALPAPMEERIEPLLPRRALRMFLDALEELQGLRVWA